MLLKVLERVTLLGVLPESGDFLTLKIVRQLRENLSFNEDEIKALSIKTADGRITWNAEVDEGKDVEIGEKATDVVVDCLKKLDKEKKLTQQHYSLYEKFCA